MIRTGPVASVGEANSLLHGSDTVVLRQQEISTRVYKQLHKYNEQGIKKPAKKPAKKSMLCWSATLCEILLMALVSFISKKL